MVTYCFLNCVSPTPTSTSWQCLNHPRQPQTLIVNCQLWHHMTTQSTTKKHWQHMVPTSWQCWLIIPWRGNNVAETSGWEVHLTYSCTFVSFQYTYCFCSVWWNQTKFYKIVPLYSLLRPDCIDLLFLWSFQDPFQSIKLKTKLKGKTG